MRSPMTLFIPQDGVDLLCQDWRGGQPIAFPHGWPLRCDDRAQMTSTA